MERRANIFAKRSTGDCDGFRTKNALLLQGVLEEDLGLMRAKARLLTEVEAETMPRTTGAAYDAALKAECSRPGAEPAMCGATP